MKQFVCNYAPVRFLPYRDVGEFVNVGMVMHCPQTNFFGYRLVSLQRTARVTGFFPELDAELFKSALRGITRELERAQSCHRLLLPGESLSPALAKEQIYRFCELTRRREGLLHFGDVGTLMAATPQEALESLFGRFVERPFLRAVELGSAA